MLLNLAHQVSQVFCPADHCSFAKIPILNTYPDPSNLLDMMRFTLGDNVLQKVLCAPMSPSDCLEAQALYIPGKANVNPIQDSHLSDLFWGFIQMPMSLHWPSMPTHKGSALSLGVRCDLISMIYTCAHVCSGHSCFMVNIISDNGHLPLPAQSPRLPCAINCICLSPI